MKPNLTTYNRNDFFNNWEEMNKNLGKRWDSVLITNPHKDLGVQTITDKYFVRAITKHLKDWMPHKKGQRVLKFDLYNEATGTGGTMRWFIGRGYDCYGVDISSEVVKLAKKRFAKEINTSHFKIGDIRKLPFPNNYFDVVYNFGTIEHVRENALAVKEAFRVLKPGGFFITGSNNKLNIWGNYLINELADQVFSRIISYEPSYTPWEQTRWLKQAGFERIQTTGWITFPHLIRYLDLIAEWKKFPRWARFVLDTLLVKPFIYISEITDTWDWFRYLGMHTTAYGYKPKKRASLK